MRAAAFILALALVLAAASPSLAAKLPEGRLGIAGVRVEYPAEPAGDLKSVIDIRPGDEYSERRIRESIKRLYLKGMFRDISVYRDDTPEGAVLTYRLTPRPWVYDIEVEGNDELATSRITAAMSIKERDFVDERLMARSEENIRKLYRKEGFGSAEVRVRAEHISPVRDEIIAEVAEGPPTLAGDISFVGNIVLPEEDLLDELEFGEGDILRLEDIEGSVENITELYVDEGYVNVAVTRPEPLLESGTEDVVFGIDAGPRLVVSFEGNDGLSESDLRDVLTFWRDRDASPDSISDNLDRLVDYYHENGFYLCAVTSRTEQAESGGEVHVRYIIIEGPRAALEEITLEGNETLPDDDLLEVMELYESGWFGSCYVTDEKVAKDAERLVTLYATRGFLSAKVEPGNVAFSEDGSESYISFGISEGPMTVVRGVSVEGNSVLSSEEIISSGSYVLGTPFNPQLEKESVNNILNLYSQRGYIHAEVELEKRFEDENLHAELVYRVKEGGRVIIGDILLRGNEDTHDSLIMKELLVDTGDPYDYEKILRSQRRIYRLGFFSKARIEPVEPLEEEPVKDLLVTLKERDAGALEFGVGYGDFDRYRGFWEVSYSNLFGLAHRVSARMEVSTREFKSVLGYKWPWFLGTDLVFRSNLAYLDAEKVNYDIDDLIASAGFDRSYGDNITASIEYKYEKLDLSAAPGAVLSPEDRDKSNLASISPSVVFDYRDDPFNPTSGSIHGLTLKLASEFLGSTTEFFKLTGQTSWFFSLYDDIVFAASLRGGYEGRFRKDVRPPISERFFLGGASSLRGYDQDTVAPRGPDGTPTGGDLMFLTNLEFRFPLPYDLGFVVFVDAGNVWLVDGDDRVTTGASGLRCTAGAGLRYDTPVGPLRLDYGYRLNPLPGEAGGEIHFTLGHAF